MVRGRTPPTVSGLSEIGLSGIDDSGFSEDVAVSSKDFPTGSGFFAEPSEVLGQAMGFGPRLDPTVETCAAETPAPAPKGDRPSRLAPLSTHPRGMRRRKARPLSLRR